MRTANIKPSRVTTQRSKPRLNGKRHSFRDLKAFGIWSDRDDVKDPVAFAKQLRSRMEHMGVGGSIAVNEL